jgi:putative phosphoribosyl transferase
MRYPGRREAGESLAVELERLELGPCVVAGIPRGGMLVAAPIARCLGAPLAPMHARKLASRRNPEFAFGAVDQDEHAVVEYRSVIAMGIEEPEIERAKATVRSEIASRARQYPGPSLAELLPAPTVVLVDDGLATGLTMQAAIHYVARHGAEATVVAVPCAASQAADEVRSLLRRSGDRLVCPWIDPHFHAVGEHYRDFPQVSDVEVMLVMRAL